MLPFCLPRKRGRLFLVERFRARFSKYSPKHIQLSGLRATIRHVALTSVAAGPDCAHTFALGAMCAVCIGIRLPSTKFPRLAFVDLETTGGMATADRITEVGIVEVDQDGVREWSSLVNPQMRIPPFIQSLTGISDAMVKDAPTFEELADEIAARLSDRIFIAHNARFDHGFLKNEFKRTGRDFRPPVLCTVRLSRKLFPGFARHNLDSIIERHRLNVTERHRALGDARLIWQFWQDLRKTHEHEELEATVAKLVSRPSLPSRLNPERIETMPTKHGVYLFYGENELPLYIGKSNNLRKRVLAHFSGDYTSPRELELSQQTERIEWIETAGELGALLQEAMLIKQLMPTHNQQLRATEMTCAWRLLKKNGKLVPAIATPDDLFFAHDPDYTACSAASAPRPTA
jgi:DNA polymerase III subunit epsilon